ncbi:MULTISPECIES: hypothetical protein [unclassified Acinetobacter]|uniref:hypothetical protein n=1 Tax=unclassified Acinetobacter TaxID=196816 RepID=UPI0035BA5101
MLFIAWLLSAILIALIFWGIGLMHGQDIRESHARHRIPIKINNRIYYLVEIKLPPKY